MDKKLQLLTALLFLIQPLFASVYYVSPSGTASWELSTDINTPCSLPTANANASAGDTVLLQEGTFTGDFIDPKQSGTSDNRLVYSNYDNDSVTITDASYGIRIDGQSYITVHGLHFYYLDHFLRIQKNSNHNIIGYCTFKQTRDTNNWEGSNIYFHSQYNRVHHCTFSRWGAGTQGGMLDVGRGSVADDSSYYNLIEDNTVYYGGHHCLAAWGKYSIFRNNYLHNERSADSVYGYRCAITHGPGADRNLFEGNRIAFASKASGMSLRSSNNIFRFNVFYNNGLGGIQFRSMKDCTPAHYNHVYNNVFYNNGHEATYVGFSGGIYFSDGGDGVPDPTGNVVKNNIFYKNKGGPITTDAVSDPQVVASNWETGDPLFIDDESPLGPFNPNLPDFHLQKESQCIDGGAFIAKITSAGGSGTQFQVEDAGFFTNGWGMIAGDELHLEDSSQKARILNIDYSSNTITVDKSLTWTQNMGISLAYSGLAPDLGAHEYTGVVQIQNFNHKSNSKAPQIIIYQSTSKRIVTIQLSETSTALTVGNKLEIYNLSGKLIDKLKLRNGKCLWNYSHVSTGMYLMRMEGFGDCLGQRLFLIR